MRARGDPLWLYRSKNVAALAFLLLAVCGSAPPCLGLDNGLGRTPVLAYSTWNYFNTAVNETLVQQLADALVATGLRDLGYQTLNVR